MAAVGTLQYDIRSRIIFNVQPIDKEHMHPVMGWEGNQADKKRINNRHLSIIERVVIDYGHCRKYMVMEDSRVNRIQRNHIVIDKLGKGIRAMRPDQYSVFPKEYNIFVEGDFNEPMPIEQREALRYVLHAFNALVGELPVYLSYFIRNSNKRPGPFLDQNILESFIYSVGWNDGKSFIV